MTEQAGTPRVLDGTAPRRTVRPDPLERLSEQLRDLRRQVEELGRAASNRNASISGGNGLRVYGEDGKPRVQLLPDGTIVAFGDDGTPVVRMGAMVETADDPGSAPYGIEVYVNGSWLQYGITSIAWGDIGGKPTSYPPSTHQHLGGDITSAVANATQAVNAARADRADGVTAEAFAREVGGIPGSTYAMWMHSTGVMGRNTSSIKYKQNVRPLELDPADVLQLQPVLYDRKATNGDGYTPPASTDELGLIAEEVQKVAPQLVVYFEGKVDGVRYDLVALALLSVVKAQQASLETLESEQRDIRAALTKAGIKL